MFSGSGGYSEKLEEECTEQFDSQAEETSKFYVGGGAFKTDPEEWYQALTDDVGNIAPSGSGTEIAPLFEHMTMTKKNFPQIGYIEAKAAHIQLLLTEAYCDRVAARSGGFCEKNPLTPLHQIKKNGVEGGPNNENAGEVVVGTNVYRFGGVNPFCHLSTASKYNALDGKWDAGSVNNYPEALRGIGAVAVGMDVYLMGGIGDGGTSAKVRKFDATRNGELRQELRQRRALSNCAYQLRPLSASLLPSVHPPARLTRPPAYAEMAPMASGDESLRPAAVTMGDGSQQIFYTGYNHPEFKMFSPTANEHTTITLNGASTGDRGLVCLASRPGTIKAPCLTTA